MRTLKYLHSFGRCILDSPESILGATNLGPTPPHLHVGFKLLLTILLSIPPIPIPIPPILLQSPKHKMRLTTILLSLASLAVAADLGIETTHKVECTRKTENGDNISMHYKGTLQADGSEFDSSYKRNSPLNFKLGSGRVIKG